MDPVLKVTSSSSVILVLMTYLSSLRVDQLDKSVKQLAQYKSLILKLEHWKNGYAACLILTILSIITTINRMKTLYGKKPTESSIIIQPQSNIIQQQNSQVRQRIQCSICLDKPAQITLKPCKHKICKLCLIQLGKLECPFCRAEIQDFIA